MEQGNENKEVVPVKEDEKKKKVIYYEDNYTETTVLPETEDMPEIKVCYKPLNMLQSSQLTDKVLEGRTVESAAMATLEMLTRHIVSWNVEKPDGTVVAFKSIEELQHLDPGVTNAIARLIRKDKSSPEADIKAITAELKNS